MLTGLLVVTISSGQTIVVFDDYNVTGSGTGFALGEGVNSGINPPTTRLTGTAAANLRYIQTATGKTPNAYSITTNKLVVAAAPNSGRFTLSADGTTPFDFSTALGTSMATPANPVIYDLWIKMANTASAIARFSFGFGTEDANVDVLDFCIQLWRTNSANNFYAVQKRIDAYSSGVEDLNKTIITLWPNSFGTEISFLIRVFDAGPETNAYNSRVLVSTNAGSSWFYDTRSDPDLPNGWRLDGPTRNITWDQAPLTGSGQFTYDDFKLVLFPAKTWTGGGGNNNWGNTANWTEAIPPRDGDSLVFTGTARQANNNNIPAGTLTLVPAIVFNNGDFTLSQNALTITRGITNIAGNNTINLSLVFPAQICIECDSGTLTLSGILGGSGAIAKRGNGVLILSGANTNAGNTTVLDGTLKVNNSSGSATGSGAVIVNRSGTLTGSGSVSGAVAVDGTVAPGDGVGTLTTGAETWNGGGKYVWELNDADTPGGWDKLDAGANAINVAADSANKFTLELKTLSGTSPGLAADFDPDQNYTWQIAAAGSVQNFAVTDFTINDAAFQNDLKGGTFAVEADSGGINLKFVRNQGPMAGTRSVVRVRGTSLKIKVSDLLAENTSDPDGDGRELVDVGVDTAPSHGSVSVAGGYILYVPNDLNSTDSDSFSYKVKDVRAYRSGDTVRTAMANIQIATATAVGGHVGPIDTSSGSVTVNFSGIPGYWYDVERSTDLTSWQVVDTVMAPGNGQFSFQDTNPPQPSAFYRLKYNPPTP